VSSLSGDAGLPALLGGLEDRLRRFGAPVVEAFRPGAPPDHMRAVLAAEGLAAPDELLEWWGWHDGADTPAVDEGPGIVERPENTLVASWHLLSLGDAVRIRRWVLDDYATIGAPGVVPSTWIPLLHFTGTPFLAADTAATGASPLYVVDGSAGLPERPPSPHFASVAELVAVLVRLFDDGVVRPDPDDERVASLRSSPVTDDVRRLTRW
jgi:hypothetical protein